MTFRDSTDEEIAKEVLKRLRDRGLRTLRQLEKAAPVSRTTLAGWQAGSYTMKGPTRESCIAWLAEPAPEARPLTEEEERAIAAKWMRAMAKRLEDGLIAPTEAEREKMGAARSMVPPGTGRTGKKRAP